jgi:hypothetical protein
MHSITILADTAGTPPALGVRVKEEFPVGFLMEMISGALVT